jgi:hypothetical protein
VATGRFDHGARQESICGVLIVAESKTVTISQTITGRESQSAGEACARSEAGSEACG